MLARRLGLSLTLLVTLALAGCPGNPNMPGTDGGSRDVGPPSDGGGSDSGTMMMSTITLCPGDATPPLASGVCEVSGAGPGLLIQGDILAPHEVFRGGQVFVDSTGTIACVGCDCSSSPGASAATRVTCPNGVVSPGLVNAHEHLASQGLPPVRTDERYEHRSDWRDRDGAHTHLSGPNARMPDVNVPWGELRMVLGGATSINGQVTPATMTAVRGLLRNLDDQPTEEGLMRSAAHYDTFPLDDFSTYLQIATGCDGYSTRRRTASDIARDSAYTPHIAEGIGATARNEFLCQSAGAYDLIQPQTAMIHGVGLLPVDMQQMAVDGATLIWSPRSNVSLYGDTARVVEYDRMGVPIALGSDWIYTGSMNMLREMQCADELNATYYDGYFSDESLWRMATYNGALALGFEDVLGSIVVGQVADLAIFDGAMHVDHRAVIDAAPGDVALVLRSGVPLYGEDGVVLGIPTGGTDCETLDVCGEARRACVMRETGMTLAALTAANAGMYPLFDCDPTPMNEPTCHPSRDGMGSFPMPSQMGSTVYSGMTSASDVDGDGIENAMDDCPRVFNPVRPMDMGVQADSDMDGLGDSCDPCPLAASTTTCGTVDPNDRDGDMVVDTVDNCPMTPNTDQADTDADLHGNACDPCPTTANPGAALCPASIYSVQMGTTAVGARVQLHGVVTAVGTTGFFMQVETTDADYTVPDYSGVFVYTTTAPTVAPGATVRVDGTVSTFGGEIQITTPSVTMVGTGTIPAPVAVAAAAVATGGARARALEGVLATVTNVTVSDVAPAPGAGDTAPTNEFAVDAMLRVDDLLFALSPFPVVGETFAAITGVVALRNGNSKLLPRSAADVVAGPSRLVGFSPTPSFTRVGRTDAPTFPMPLSVRLTRPSTTPTTVAITVTSGGAALTVTGGGVTIPAGMVSAPVVLTGVSQAADVTLTATLGADSLPAHVRVLGASEVPTSFTLSPTTATLMTGASTMFTVTLDLPAGAAGQSIALSETTGGTLPSMVLVPADALEASFTFVAGAGAATGTLTASGLGVRTAALTILAGPPPHLVINEVDYDQPGSTADSMEYVEIYNPSGVALSLAGLSLVLVNGGLSPPAAYTTVDLSSVVDVPAHGYLVVGSAALLATITADREIALTGTSNLVQNGPTDGVAIYDASTMTLVDALAYEGALTMCTISGHTFSLVEGTAAPATRIDPGNGSLARIPNGSDTNDANTDWAVAATSTPGATN